MTHTLVILTAMITMGSGAAFLVAWIRFCGEISNYRNWGVALVLLPFVLIALGIGVWLDLTS